MNRKMLRQFVLTAAAAAAVLTAGVSYVAAAGAAVPNTVYSGEEAGFQASSLPGDLAPWHYRYVQAQVTLPDITSGTLKAAIPGGYGASVRLSDGSQTLDLGISTTPASGNYNAAFAVENADGKTYACLNGNSPAVKPGDTVLLTLFYDYSGGAASYAAQDLTTPAGSFSGTCQDPGHAFTAARIVAGFAANDYSAPAPPVGGVNGSVRLVGFTHTVVTSRTGIRGSAGSARWPARRVTLTSDGSGSSTVLALTPFAWGTYAAAPDNVVRGGRNFTVYLSSVPL